MNFNKRLHISCWYSAALIKGVWISRLFVATDENVNIFFASKCYRKQVFYVIFFSCILDKSYSVFEFCASHGNACASCFRLNRSPLRAKFLYHVLTLWPPWTLSTLEHSCGLNWLIFCYFWFNILTYINVICYLITNSCRSLVKRLTWDWWNKIRYKL